MPITRYHGEPRDITIDYASDPLVPFGSTFAAIVEISMALKLDPTQDADDAYLEKTQTGGGVSRTGDTGAHTYTLALTDADYASITPGVYTLVLGVQVSVGQPFIELDMADPLVEIVADEHRTDDGAAQVKVRPDPLATIADIERILGRSLSTAERLRAPGLLHSASVKVRSFCRGQVFSRVDNDQVPIPAQGTSLILPQRPVIDVTAVAAIGREGGANIPLTGWSYDGLETIDLRQATDVANDFGTWWANIREHVNVYRVTYSHGSDVIPDDPNDVTAHAVARVMESCAPEGTTQRTLGQYTEQHQQSTGSPGNSPWLTKQEKEQLRDAGFRRRAGSIPVRRR